MNITDLITAYEAEIANAKAEAQKILADAKFESAPISPLSSPSVPTSL